MCDESSSSPNSEFYDEEFDGISAEMGGGNSRGTAAVNDSYSVGFGIPLDVDEISARASDEFDAAGAEKTRAISAVELLPYSSHSPTLDPFAREIDSGSTFQASPGIFGASTSFPPPTHEEIQVAPPLPPFVKPARTSFRCAQALPALRAALEAAFAATSVTFSPAEDTAESDPHPCAYACSSVCLLSMVTFEVRIFALPAATNAAPRHLVEVRHLGGCRYAFKTTAEALANRLVVTFGSTPAPSSPGACATALSARALPFPDDLALPTLRRAPDVPVLQAAVKGPETSTGGALSTPVLDLLFAGESGAPGARAEGLRAAGAGFGQSNAWTSSSVSSASDSEWNRIADRVTALALPRGKGGDGSIDEIEEDEVRAVAMTVVADIAARPEAPQSWLEAAVGAVAEGTGDDCGHVRREALRAAAALAERKGGEYAAKLVRAGAVPALEIEANGGDGVSCPDEAAKLHASTALRACRAA